MLAHILYEMTFNSYCSEDVDQKHQEIVTSLNDIYEEHMNGQVRYLSSEEVFAKLGLEKDEDKGPELERKKIENTKAAIARNEAIYQKLISDWLKEGFY